MNSDRAPLTPGSSPRAGASPGDASSVSDQSLQTLQAPSCPSPASAAHSPLEPGQCFGDFELIRMLGSGAFATVYLAKQVSLGRHVALKIGPNRGHEAQTLASLEHDHIVQVFSESIDHVRRVRLLCMQYVPGATLLEVMLEITPVVRASGTGRDYLAALDRIGRHHGEEFRPKALQERERLAAGDFFQAVCWTGGRLAGALEFAHGQGVLHRDIKPANILINAYGRPFLADFNLSTLPNAGDSLFGGTLAYMAPEHLRAFSSKDPQDLQAVDARSDVFSLGVVLFELLTGCRPYPDPMESVSEDPIEEVIQARAAAPVPLSTLVPAIPPALDTAIRTCLAPRPEHRYQNAAELRKALDGCGQLLQSAKQLPPPPAWAGPLHREPFKSLLLLSLVPNLLGTVVNIAYNFLQIVSQLTPRQMLAFEGVVLVYNSLAYPVLVGVTCWLLWRRHLDWERLRDGRLVMPGELVDIRRKLNFLATWSILGPCLGWLPGGVAFALAIHWGAEPLAAETMMHFVISFTLSGLIAVVYCYLGSQYVVLRVLLPGLNLNPSGLDERSAWQLAILPGRLALFQILAGIIPLSGALLLLLMRSPVNMGQDWGFKLLVAALIILGMLGFVLALRICQYLQRVLFALLPQSPAAPEVATKP